MMATTLAMNKPYPERKVVKTEAELRIFPNNGGVSNCSIKIVSGDLGHCLRSLSRDKIMRLVRIGRGFLHQHLHINPMDQSKRGRRPTLAGRNAKPTEQAKENICDVAVISVWSRVVVIPTSSSI
jgi:hypothetical protein